LASAGLGSECAARPTAGSRKSICMFDIDLPFQPEMGPDSAGAVPMYFGAPSDALTWVSHWTQRRDCASRRFALSSFRGLPHQWQGCQLEAGGYLKVSLAHGRSVSEQPLPFPSRDGRAPFFAKRI
jgi:hypothetical protein